jgi:hypothetical protein
MGKTKRCERLLLYKDQKQFKKANALDFEINGIEGPDK